MPPLSSRSASSSPIKATTKKLTGSRRSTRSEEKPTQKRRKPSSNGSTTSSSIRPSKLPVPRPRSRQPSSVDNDSSPTNTRRKSSTAPKPKRTHSSASLHSDAAASSPRNKSKTSAALTKANLQKKQQQDQTDDSRNNNNNNNMATTSSSLWDDSDSDENFVRPSYSRDFLSDGDDFYDDVTSSKKVKGTRSSTSSSTAGKKKKSNIKEDENDDEIEDDLRSFQSISIGRIQSDDKDNSTHCYIFLDYENINFHPKHLMLFLSSLESVLKSQLRNHRMTFSVVACGPYFLFQDDKVWIRDTKTSSGEPYQVCKRLAGIALEVLNNANVDCKVVPTNKREQADKKIMIDQLMASVNPKSAQHHHFVVVSSDVGFGSHLRSILNVPGWSSKVTASIVHNLPPDNSHLFELENSVGGSRNLMSVSDVMRIAINILKKPPPKHHSVSAASRQAKEERAKKLAEVIPLRYGVLWRPMRFDNEIIFHAPMDKNTNNEEQQHLRPSSSSQRTHQRTTSSTNQQYHQNNRHDDDVGPRNRQHQQNNNYNNSGHQHHPRDDAQSYLYQNHNNNSNTTTNQNYYNSNNNTNSSVKPPNYRQQQPGHQYHQQQHQRNTDYYNNGLSGEAFCRHCGSPDHLSRRCRLNPKTNSNNSNNYGGGRN